jgi:hypothetical protein
LNLVEEVEEVEEVEGVEGFKVESLMFKRWIKRS